MKIRKARIKDYKEINRMLVDLHKYHSDNRPDIFDTKERFFTKKEFKEDLKKCNSYYVAEEDNKILGIVEFTYVKRNKKLYTRINAIYVKEKYRKNKIATNLVEKVIKHSNKKAYKYPDKYENCVELSVYSFNKSALSFYEKMGFKERCRTLEIKKEV